MSKKLKKVLAIVLVAAAILSTTVIGFSASAAANTNYKGYNSPENSGDYAYWNGSKVVKSGSTSKDEIKWMQAALNYCVAREGLNTSYIDVDGSFGPASKKATLAFQRAAGLSADGSFGPATIQKMKSVLNDGIKTFSNGTIYKNYLQVDQTWSSKRYGFGNKSSLRDSGCGILSIVNAVYNLNGKFIEPTTVASWAHKEGLYNRNSDEGCYADVFSRAASKYGSTYGFKYVWGGSGRSTDSRLKNHVKNGGTAIIHVYNHYMTIVDYDESTGRFLVFDSAPGSGTSWNSTNRKGLTSPNGDWKTAAQLKTGNLNIDRYYLFEKV